MYFFIIQGYAAPPYETHGLYVPNRLTSIDIRDTSLAARLGASTALLRRVPRVSVRGTVVALHGLLVEVDGLASVLAVGDRLALQSRDGRAVPGEVTGFRHGLAQVMAFAHLDGLGPGARAEVLPQYDSMLDVSAGWLGRIIDPLALPLDGKGELPAGAAPRQSRGAPPDATERARVGPRIDLGVRALNCFATCRQGQRLGLFAGSGIGKSTLLSMLTRGTACDAVIVALVGERGREVREFIEDDLGPDGLSKAVVVVATSDAPPVMRRQCAYTAMTVAEHFRDEGQSVLLLMDSITRFCLALREIGLSSGEPPATRGYPPSVFAELPRLLERAGPGPVRGDGSAGFITGLFTVLVEGDDTNEPVADAVRGILDGHVVLDRRIAESGRYPAIDVARSLSRLAAGCLDTEQTGLVARARAVLALYADMADMVRLGAYKVGSDPAVDEALRLTPAIEAMLRQGRDEATGFDESFALLRQAVEG